MYLKKLLNNKFIIVLRGINVRMMVGINHIRIAHQTDDLRYLKTVYAIKKIILKYHNLPYFMINYGISKLIF